MDRNESSDSLTTECDCSGHHFESTQNQFLCEWDPKVVANMILNRAIKCEQIAYNLYPIEKMELKEVAKGFRTIGEYIHTFAPSKVQYANEIVEKMEQLKISAKVSTNR